ncbi:hypothetical protein HELRODRAFT_175607 [Helobdella robusta]|uniref:B box-type domain-containing protein n=1 Tax=Helobdella robusta TaxID=6412 RepID=T1F9F1_HELRO|nr:hypothetical protein HELRODRAFT_175607 [Helobdella robusta]ESO00630.1 hypothetical protein HELRODRAFT_175607 [Helobdella robusta]
MVDPIICINCQQLKITILLPCEHSHCLSCLEKKYPKMNIIKCTICRQLHIRPQNINSLANDEVITMLGRIKKRNDAEMSNKKYCETCEDVERAAEKYCTHCRQHLCLSCLQLHNKFKSFQTHEVVDINVNSSSYSEAINKIDYEKCPTHDLNIDIYCQNCNQFICSKCIYQHERHKFKEISSKIEKDKKKIESTIAELQKRLAIYEEKLQKFNIYTNKDKILSKIHCRANALKFEIDKYIQDLTGRIESCCDDFVNKVRKYEQLISIEKDIIESRICSLEETLCNLNVQTITLEKYDFHVPECKKFEISFPKFELQKPTTSLYFSKFESASKSSFLKRIGADELVGSLHIKRYNCVY